MELNKITRSVRRRVARVAAAAMVVGAATVSLVSRTLMSVNV